MEGIEREVESVGESVAVELWDWGILGWYGRHVILPPQDGQGEFLVEILVYYRGMGFDKYWCPHTRRKLEATTIVL